MFETYRLCVWKTWRHTFVKVREWLSAVLHFLRAMFGFWFDFIMCLSLWTHRSTVNRCAPTHKQVHKVRTTCTTRAGPHIIFHSMLLVFVHALTAPLSQRAHFVSCAHVVYEQVERVFMPRAANDDTTTMTCAHVLCCSVARCYLESSLSWEQSRCGLKVLWITWQQAITTTDLIRDRPVAAKGPLFPVLIHCGWEGEVLLTGSDLRWLQSSVVHPQNVLKNNRAEGEGRAGERGRREGSGGGGEQGRDAATIKSDKWPPEVA